MSRLAGAIDIGGTKLLVGLVDERGSVLARRTAPTPTAAGPAAVADLAASLLQLLLTEQGAALTDLAGIGATVPGLADTRQGRLRYAPAHGWRDVPFAALLAERLGGLPTAIANDVNACALAEQRFGAGQSARSLVWITVSTGIGGGLVLDGRLYEGGGAAGEIGHLVVAEGGPLCGCGHYGCLEAVAAGPAIARRAREAGLAVVDAAEVALLAQAGDAKAISVMAQTARYIGRAVAFCHNLLDPDLVVLGGGVAPSLDLAIVEDTVRARAIFLPDRQPRLALTALGYEAALVGAGALVFA